MTPSALQTIALARRVRWERAGLTWTYEEGPSTDNPATWLTLRGPNVDGFVKVWASGDAEVDWGVEGDAHARHYDLTSVEDLASALDDLEEALSTYL